VSQFWREVEVVGPEPRDPFGVMKLFDPGLEHAIEGDEAKEGQRRQQYQAEGDQGVPQVADVRASRSASGFEIYAALPLACRLASDEIRLLQ
jgi:hypothetical protein